MIFGIALLLVILTGAAASFVLAIRAALNSRDTEGRVIFAFGALCALAGFLLILWIVTTDWSPTVPDGCYRIVTGTSIGTSSNGNVIVMSDRTYTPIQCP